MQINITSTKLVTDKGHKWGRENKHLTRNYEIPTLKKNDNTNSCAYTPKNEETPWKVCWLAAVAVSRFQRLSWGIFREERVIGLYGWHMPQRFTFWYNAMGFLSTWELLRENYVSRGREKQVKFIEKAYSLRKWLKIPQCIALYIYVQS